MNKPQKQVKAQQLMLRAQNNPTSCSNAELLIPNREVRSQALNENKSGTTLNLVTQDIRDYLDIGIGMGKTLNVA